MNIKNLFFILIILIPLYTFSVTSGETVDEQLKKTGFTALRSVLEESKAKSIRYKSIYPDENIGEKKAQADTIYGNDYVIKDINDADDVFKDKIIKYYPGLQGTTLTGLTGLINTISARTLKKGQYLIGAKYMYSKIVKSSGKDLDFQPGEKADFSSIYINAAMGVSNNFEVGYTLPVHTLDIQDDILFPYTMKESGVGDVALRGKFSFPFGNEKGAAAFGFGIKLPSGNDENLAPAQVTGEPDFEVFGAVSTQFGLINGHVNIGYSFTGNGDDVTKPYTFNDDKFTFNAGLEYSKNDFITIILEINGEDWGAFGDKADLVAGVRAKMGEKIQGVLAFPISMTNEQYYGYDFKLIMGWDYKF